MNNTPITSFKNEYEVFSNHYLIPITFGNITYTSVENAYMASKTSILNERVIFQTCTPKEAKKYGGKNSTKITLRSEWSDTFKLNIMWGLVWQKWVRYPQLTKILLSTDDRELVEGNWWNDKFWGVYNGEGKNYLGKMHMRARTLLKEK